MSCESEPVRRHLVLVIFATVAVLAMACSGSSEVKMDTVTTPSGLQYTDIVVGTGTAASQGDTVVVHYTGWLMDGTKFDSSLDRGQPFDFVLGQGRVIKGWVP